MAEAPLISHIPRVLREGVLSDSNGLALVDALPILGCDGARIGRPELRHDVWVELSFIEL